MLDGTTVEPYFMTETSLIVNAHSCEIDGASMKQVLAFAPRRLAATDAEVTAEEMHDTSAGEINVKLWRIVSKTGAGRRAAPTIVSSHVYEPSLGVRLSPHVYG